MTVCDYEHFIQYFGLVLAFLAAFSWLLSLYFGRASHFDKPTSVFDRAQQTKSKYNQLAIALAAFSAIAQVTTALMPACKVL
jgi:hypothetical protein